MMNPLRMMWERLSGSLWLVPGLIAVLALLLAIGMVEWSGVLSAEVRANFPRLFGADASGSRDALATIAGAIITVAGVTFSITVLVLSQAATQYTPRVLRNFMRDHASQVCLGIMIGVFLYCLVVIRTIRGEGGPEFVPSLAVILAFLLAVLAMAALVYFIHHIASSLEVGSILERISRETLEVIDRDYPDAALDSLGDAEEAGRASPQELHLQSRAVVFKAPRSGFVQAVDMDSLRKLAIARGAEIRLLRSPGDFVTADAPLAEVLGAIDAPTLHRAMSRAVSVDTYRTILQDPAFGIRQITDIALKALSPAMNDVTTAVTCVDYLQAILTFASKRRIGARAVDRNGAGCVLAREPSFESLVGDAFDEIRLAGASNPRLLRRLVELIEAVGDAAPMSRRPFLLSKLAAVRQAAQTCIAAPADQGALLDGCRRVQEAWQEPALRADLAAR